MVPCDDWRGRHLVACFPSCIMTANTGHEKYAAMVSAWTRVLLGGRHRKYWQKRSRFHFQNAEMDWIDSRAMPWAWLRWGLERPNPAWGRAGHAQLSVSLLCHLRHHGAKVRVGWRGTGRWSQDRSWRRTWSLAIVGPLRYCSGLAGLGRGWVSSSSSSISSGGGGWSCRRERSVSAHNHFKGFPHVSASSFSSERGARSMLMLSLRRKQQMTKKLKIRKNGENRRSARQHSTLRVVNKIHLILS